MGAEEGVIARIDQLIDYFNRRKMDLPDGLFDRRTQFIVNGATFESLLSATPDDPLVMMLARGPAGYRFTVKALQHALPDAKIEPGEITREPQQLAATLWLSGTLRGTADTINVPVRVTLRLTASGAVEVAEATIDPGELQKIRDARLRS